MACRFRFRLETVRRLREQARDAQRRVVADAVRAVTRIEDRIARLARETQDACGRSRNARDFRFLDVVSLCGHQLYQNWLHRKTAESHQELAEKQAVLERERTKLAEASTRLKVIENLRERQWKRHLVEVAREEQAASDEAAQQGYLRRRREQKREVAA